MPVSSVRTASRAGGALDSCGVLQGLCSCWCLQGHVYAELSTLGCCQRRPQVFPVKVFRFYSVVSAHSLSHLLLPHLLSFSCHVIMHHDTP